MKKWIRGTNSIVIALAITGIFIVATTFLHSLTGMQWDVTKNKKFTLSDQTNNTLQKLNQDIHVIAFTGGNASPYLTRQVMDLLNEYEKRNHHITVQQVDMLKQPSMAKQYNVDPGGEIIIEKGKQKKTITFYDLFVPGQQQGQYSFYGEEKFTQAIVGLTSSIQHHVYFISGHGEVPLSQMTAFRSGLEGENDIVQSLNLYQAGSIPKDTDMLFVVGPQRDFNDKEAQMIEAYIKGKGKIYFALGYADQMKSWKNIDAILAAYGIQNQNAVAIEPQKSVLFDPLTIVPQYGDHPITSKLQQSNMVTVMPLAISLADNSAKTDYQAALLLKTSKQSYGETDLTLLQQGKSKQDSQDINGPLNLAYAITTKDNQPKALVIGDAEFLIDDQIVQQGNKDFALNSVGWIMEQKNQLTIRPRKGDAFQQALIMPNQAKIIYYGTVFIFPLLFLLIGGLIWLRRRRG